MISTNEKKYFMSISVLKELVITWKAETEKGDELCKIPVYQDAVAHYMNAMIAAELLIEHNEFAWGNGVPVPEWYYVSCLHLASVFVELKQMNEASTYLLYGSYKIKQLASLPTKEYELRDAAEVFSKRAFNVYLNFFKITGKKMPPDITSDETFFQVEKLKLLFDNAEWNKN
jgi:hypothetical protein